MKGVKKIFTIRFVTKDLNGLSGGRISSPPDDLLLVRRARAPDPDYDDYQADGRFENDPQFPTYSNWQPADDLGTFRINSPRRKEAEEMEEARRTPEEVSLGGGGQPAPPEPSPPRGKNKDGSYISVKLPDDIMKHLGRQYGLDKNQHVQKQILGIPSDHLESLDFDESQSQLVC